MGKADGYFRGFVLGSFLLVNAGPCFGVPPREGVDKLKHRPTSVTIYSDRARVTRTAKATLQAGLHWVELPGLLETIEPGSLRAHVLSGSPGEFSGELVELLSEQAFEKGVLKEEINQKLKELEGLHRDKLARVIEEANLEFLYRFVRSLNFQPSSEQRSIEPTALTLFNENALQLSQAVGSLNSETKRLEGALLRAEKQRRDLDEKIAWIQKQLEDQTIRTNQRWLTNVYALIRSEKDQPLVFEVSYIVPNAKWYPIYDVRAELDKTQNKVKMDLITAALLEQHTGEDWEDVRVTVSSLDPMPLYTPTLERWVLKETRVAESPPRLAESNQVRNFMDAQMAAPASTNEALGALRKDGLSERTKVKVAKAEMARTNKEMAPEKKSKEVDSFVDKDFKESPAEARAPEPSRQQTAVQVQQAPDNLYNLRPLSEAYSIVATLREMRGKPGETETRPFALTGMRPLGPVSHGDSKLPAVQAGGRKLEFTSPFAVSLKHDEAARKIPLHSQRFSGKMWHYAVPKKDSRVYVKALTKNTTDHPLLGGDAQIFLDGDLINKVWLGTTAEDAAFQLDLGVDPDVIVSRTSTRKSEDKGLIMLGKHVTKVSVKIEAVNHHAYPIVIELHDHYPYSNQGEIDVTFLETNVNPANHDRHSNLLKWEVPLREREKKVVQFSYQVAYPKKYIVEDFD